MCIKRRVTPTLSHKQGCENVSDAVCWHTLDKDYVLLSVVLACVRKGKSLCFSSCNSTNTAGTLNKQTSCPSFQTVAINGSPLKVCHSLPSNTKSRVAVVPQKLITLGRFWQQSRVWTLQISTRVDIRALTRMWRLGSINKEPALRSQEGLKSKERSFSILYYHSDSYMFTYVATHVSNSCVGTPP